MNDYPEMLIIIWCIIFIQGVRYHFSDSNLMAIQLINFGEFYMTLILKILRANGLLKIVVRVRETFSPDINFLVYLFGIEWL